MKLIRVISEYIIKRKQHTFIYCPKCNTEMISNGTALEDAYGIIKYRCSKCGNISFWDFTHFPVPYLRTCADCRYVDFDNSGNVWCDKNCAPSNQDKFEYKVKK